MVYHDHMKRCGIILLLVVVIAGTAVAQFVDPAFGHPYLQNSRSGAVTIIWWTNTNTPGTVTYGDKEDVRQSKPQPINLTRPEAGGSVLRYRHVVRLGGLQPASQYRYTVQQGDATFAAKFRTAPPAVLTPIRFLVWADTETEPASHGSLGNGAPPGYPMDQNDGIRACVAAASKIDPDFILLAGDITECGGELEDWDEFFRKVNDRDNPLAAHIPIFAVPGNHDYNAGPDGGNYDQPGSEAHAMHKFHAHLELPSNERFYQFEWGPATFIGLDTCNQSPAGLAMDTNLALLGENDPGGGRAPDWMPGSRQHQWLVRALAEAQKRSLFTFVFFHYMPFGSGPHSFPSGLGAGRDWLSGYPLRQLDPLFHEYGVAAVFCGHEEMMEAAETQGETNANEPHKLRYFTPGTAGDGLRPAAIANTARVFHADDTTIGRHYGFLDVTIQAAADRAAVWRASIRQTWIDPAWAQDPTRAPLGGYYDAETPDARYDIEKTIK